MTNYTNNYIKELINNKQQLRIYSDNISQAICPKIIGNEYCKRLLALQLLCDPRRDEKFHAMMIGSPASGKTDLLNELINIKDNSILYCNQSTKVGIRETIESCDGGLMAVDEFDKLNNDVFKGLLELMQLGRMTINIHNNHYTITSRTNLLVACNPKYKVWIKSMTILNQLPFPKDLLTRFHIIMPFYKVDTKYYPDIARGMCNQEYNNTERIKELNNYVSLLIDKYPIIKVPEEIADLIGEYVKKLEESSIFKEIISPRTISGIISIVKARARMNGNTIASEEDFEDVKELYDYFYMNK